MEKNKTFIKSCRTASMRQYLHGQHNLLMAIIWLVLYYFDVLLFAMPKDSGEAGSYSCD